MALISPLNDARPLTKGAQNMEVNYKHCKTARDQEVLQQVEQWFKGFDAGLFTYLSYSPDDLIFVAQRNDGRWKIWELSFFEFIK